MKLQNKHDKDDRWIDTSFTTEVKKNTDDNVCEGEYVRAALNMSGQEWADFIDSLTQEQKIQLSRCWD